jgi:hypothetical protein
MPHFTIRRVPPPLGGRAARQIAQKTRFRKALLAEDVQKPSFRYNARRLSVSHANEGATE